MRTIHLLGGVDAAEFVSLLLGPGFFLLALATPFFGVRQVQENAESYTHHLVISGAFIAVGLTFTLFTNFSALGFLIVGTPNAFWFITARNAQRRARLQRQSQDEPDV